MIYLFKSLYIYVHPFRFVCFRQVLALVKEWQRARGARGESSTYQYLPVTDVLEWTPEELNQWIPLFVHEIRKRDGGDYRAKTVMEYILILQSAFLYLRGKSYSFLKNDMFLAIRNALDNRMRALQSVGLGNNPVQAEVVTLEMEEALWIEGHLGEDTAAKLLNTVVYLLGVHLGLRTGEHRLLRRSMFQVRELLRWIGNNS